MKIIFSFLFVLLSFISNAQKWAPLGMTWTYVYIITGFGPGRDSPVTWAAEDTVTIKGHFCTKIQPKGAGKMGLDNMHLSMATYEDSGRVYWYSPISDTFTVLYDFNKKVGESWMMYGIQKPDYMGIPSFDTVDCPLKVTVTAVGIDTINGIPLRTLELKSTLGFVFDGKITEGIGHFARPRPWAGMLQHCPFVVADLADDYFGLRCIDNGTIGFYDFKTAPYCDWKYTSIKKIEPIASSISISPNPSNGKITIIVLEKINPTEALVYNMLGQLVYQSPLTFIHQEATLKLAPLSGIYTLLLDDKKGNIIRERFEIY